MLSKSFLNFYWFEELSLAILASLERAATRAILQPEIIV
jgi:hypothetical protein